MAQIGPGTPRSFSSPEPWNQPPAVSKPQRAKMGTPSERKTLFHLHHLELSRPYTELNCVFFVLLVVDFAGASSGFLSCSFCLSAGLFSEVDIICLRWSGCVTSIFFVVRFKLYSPDPNDARYRRRLSPSWPQMRDFTSLGQHL